MPGHLERIAGHARTEALGLVAQLDFGSMVSVLASLSMAADGNVTRLTDTSGGIAQRERVTTLGQPFLLDGAADITAQFRF